MGERLKNDRLKAPYKQNLLLAFLTGLGTFKPLSTGPRTVRAPPPLASLAMATAKENAESANAYELEREARIARNQAVLRELKVGERAAALDAAAASTVAAKTARKWRPSSVAGAKRPRPLPPPRPRSTRAAAAKVTTYVDAPALPEDVLRGASPKSELEHHLTCEEWCAKEGITPGPKMTGHFTGWVSDEARDALGLAASAEEAWNSNHADLGGGVVKTAFRTPKGESAKEFARKMMKKNPNAFFYRHNLPGEETKQGDWSPAEIDRFVEVAKTHGCGDKWGLFASHIPGRVGYQCSAAYRQKIIPAGLLMDDNFVLSASGCAAWVGRPGARAGTGKDYD